MDRAARYGIRATWLTKSSSKAMSKSRHVLMAVGHVHYPRTRQSAGMYVIDGVAKNLGIDGGWRENLAAQALVTESDDVVLVKTLDYNLLNSFDALNLAADALGVTQDTTVSVLCYDPTLKVGELSLSHPLEEELYLRMARPGVFGVPIEAVVGQLVPIEKVLQSPRWQAFMVGIHNDDSFAAMYSSTDRAIAAGFPKRKSDAQDEESLRLQVAFSADDLKKLDFAAEQVSDTMKAWAEEQSSLFEQQGATTSRVFDQT